MKCLFCNTENPDGSKFCANCGANLTIPPHVVANEQTETINNPINDVKSSTPNYGSSTSNYGSTPNYGSSTGGYDNVPKGKNNTWLIVGLVCGGALLLLIIGGIVIFTTVVKPVIDEYKEGSIPSFEYNYNNDDYDNDYDDSDSYNYGNDNKVSQPINAKTLSELSAKTTSVESPAKSGDTAIIDLYNVGNGKYENAAVKLVRVIRGSEAKKIVDAYNANENHFLKFKELLNNCEYAVAEFEVTYPKEFVTSKYGNSVSLHTNITGNDGKTLKYNGYSYYQSSLTIQEADSMKTGESATIKVGYQIPIGCKEYLISTGAYDELNAYFKGE